MQKQSGFTMIELIVVVAIVAVITAISIPNYLSWLPEHRLRSAADDLNSCFQLAKLQAVRENAPVTIQVSAANDFVTVFFDDGAGGGTADNRIREGGEQAFKNVQMPAGVDLTGFVSSSAQPWFAYDGRGRPLNNQIGSIYLDNTKGTTLGVRINITGNPRFIEKVGSIWVLK